MLSPPIKPPTSPDIKPAPPRITEPNGPPAKPMVEPILPNSHAENPALISLVKMPPSPTEPNNVCPLVEINLSNPVISSAFLSKTFSAFSLLYQLNANPIPGAIIPFCSAFC